MKQIINFIFGVLKQIINFIFGVLIGMQIYSFAITRWVYHLALIFGLIATYAYLFEMLEYENKKKDEIGNSLIIENYLN